MNAFALMLAGILPIAQGADLEEIMTSPIGTGQPGYSGDGGPADKAQLNSPFDVAYDIAGNLYISDTSNHCIRRVDARSGIITTVAGIGEPGFSGDGGLATAARLNEPYGLAIDARGNIYFADRLNRRVRHIAVDTGIITTIAGNGTDRDSGDRGPATEAGIVEPNGLALDGRGRLYIADVAGHRVRVYQVPTQILESYAGTGQPRHEGDGGPAEAAALFGPRAVEVGPDGTVYILERNGNTLRAVSPVDGVITTVAGTGKKGYTGDGGPARDATFNGPKELDIDNDGNVFIVDTENHAIRRIDARTGDITTVAGNGHAGGGGDDGLPTDAQLDRPHGVAVGPEGVSITIGDTNNHRVRHVGPRP